MQYFLMNVYSKDGSVKQHVYYGEQAPNTNWVEDEPDIDTRDFYEANGKLKSGRWAVMEFDY